MSRTPPAEQAIIDDLQLHRFVVADPLTPKALSFYYANQTDDTQRYLIDLLSLSEVEEYRPSAFGTWGRGSAAFGCVRQNAFDNLRTVEDIPFDGPTRFNFDVGKHAHAVTQTAWHFTYQSDAEVPVDLRDKNWDCSGHIDMVTRWPDGRDPEAGEIKTVSGFGYDKAVGSRGKTGQGPSVGHVIQAGIYAYGLDLPQLRIVYIGKHRQGSFTEWLVPMELVEPYVLQELELMEWSARLVNDEGLLPPRFSTPTGPIESPPRHVAEAGRWGTPFFCSGCRWNARCRDLPSGQVPLGDAVDVRDVA